MRIWSLHPSYLDQKGLVACWRETLLAQHVLEGKTKGYKNHPQLIRFKNSDSSISAINIYLAGICDEAEKRGYKFDRNKIGKFEAKKSAINVTKGQINYEFKHLLNKLKTRDPDRYELLLTDNDNDKIDPHPLFVVVPGNVESWEKLK